MSGSKTSEVHSILVFAGVHRCFSSGYRVVSTLSGSELTGTRYTRPLSSDNSDDDSDSDKDGSVTGPLLPGLHVTGTGLVHTAPQHGQDDFRVGLAHGLVKVRVIIYIDHLTNEL